MQLRCMEGLDERIESISESHSCTLNSKYLRSVLTVTIALILSCLYNKMIYTMNRIIMRGTIK